MGSQTDAETAQMMAEVLSPDEIADGNDRLPDFHEGMTGVSESSTPAKGSAPPPSHPWPDWNQVVRDQNAHEQTGEERCIDRGNGKAYTWEQFQSFYGNKASQKWYESNVAPNPFSVWPKEEKRRKD